VRVQVNEGASRCGQGIHGARCVEPARP
jgi:hypothetical protein